MSTRAGSDGRDRRTDMATEPALRKLRRDLARKAVDYAKAGVTAEASGVMKEDVAFYLDPDRFERERDALFRRMPVVACLSSELPEAGTYHVFDDLGMPILLSRGKDRTVRAFLNICPHRGARLVRDESGKASRFTCRFHGWTFDTSGAAIGIPDAAQFCGEIDDQRQLVECPAEERHGIVFAQATPNGTMDLDAHLGEFDALLAAIGLNRAEAVHRDDLPVSANWKYGLDTFFETYHLNSLHRDTFRGLFSPVCVFDAYGPHHIYTFTPLIIDEWTDMPEDEWPIDLLPLQYFLFPNTILSVGSTSRMGVTVNIHRIFPEAADHFISKMTYCVLGGIQSDAQRAEVEASYEIARRALVEDDYSVTGEAHGGLYALPPGTLLPIGRREIGVQNFHRNIALRIS